MSSSVENIVIVGTGCAGLTAAVYRLGAGRFVLAAIVFLSPSAPGAGWSRPVAQLVGLASGASSVLDQPEDVAVEVGDGGHQAAAADVVRGLLHGGTGGGHLGQLRLDVRHVPEGHR